MTGLSRCGRQYPDFGEALRAAQARTFKSSRKHQVWPCPFGEHFHVIDGNGPLASVRPDPFPPPVRALLAKRDEVCLRCGWDGRLEAHHRRAKAAGGSSARSHTQCPCNGVMLCRFCHDLVHRNPKISRAEGWIVSQSVAKPATVGIRDPIIPHTLAYPTCDGGWNDQP